MSKIIFKKTCNECPEQYTVYSYNNYLDNKEIAYVRLRYGYLTVCVPNVDGKLIYKHNFRRKYKGNFDNYKERRKYLKIIKNKICKEIK